MHRQCKYFRCLCGGKHAHHCHIVIVRRCTYTFENAVHDDCQIKWIIFIGHELKWNISVVSVTGSMRTIVT